jgi:META domain
MLSCQTAAHRAVSFDPKTTLIRASWRPSPMAGASSVTILARSVCIFSCLAACVMLLDGSRIAKAESELSHLQGTFWHPSRIGEISDEHSNAIVRVSRGTMDFNLFCLYASYPFSYDSGSLRFHPAWQRGTRESAQCPKSLALSTIETGLASARGHALNGDGLTLLDEHDLPIMTFSRVIATGLENREWTISEYWDGAALVAAEHHARIVFWNGRVDGSPGCGALEGFYSLSGQDLKLWVGAMLAGWCPRPALTQMDRVVEALRLTGDWHVEQDLGRTVLRDKQGAIRIILSP